MYTINPAVGSQLVKFAENVISVQYFNVAGLALVTYEYLITVGAELLLSPDQARSAIPMEKRQTLHPATHIISIVTAEEHGNRFTDPVYIRILASKQAGVDIFDSVWHRLFGGICHNVNVYFPILFAHRLRRQACPFYASRSSALQYVWLAIFELGLLSLTIFKRLQYYRHSTTPLINALYRDGVYYMVTIFATSLMNTLITLFTPGAYNEVLDTLQLVLHSILASRILFNLREVDEVAHHHQFTVIEELSLQPMGFQNPKIGAWSQRTLEEP
ncbi:hypothetical protein BJ138DRAFT_1107627 [Hygrophoropsis aurantiaca]|uniref:Uncharacterized protein n=1 Tax=Hygrophoropsis aurantiaca TaxID=72124 RepID=A0ACB7ZQP7_9AGAM|nr:hypothetical protein BJ138DRAFT_1107627 [Hygrophoropsis aurantiaca]